MTAALPRRTLVLTLATAALAGCGNGRQAASTAPAQAVACTGSDLGGAFSVVRGSAGAGQIVYRLRLTNDSDVTCFVSGIPALRLLGATGKPLPTRVVPEQPGALTAAKIELAPGASASATARFSPDVPGVGEGGRRRCEPVADRLRVSPATGSLTVPVSPPTPVCEHGRLAFRLLSASGR